ncbi:MAG: DNA repair protein RecO [Bacteroidia bacterium]
MLVKTEGIVLNKIDYTDSGIIVKIYTKNFGLLSFLVRGIHRKKSAQKASLFMPLSILEIVFYNKENQEIKIPKEIRLAYPFHSIQINLIKASMAVFIAEILLKSIRETFPDNRKYDFIKSSILHFDLQEEGFSNFHLSFLIKLSNYLGISITQKYAEENVCDTRFIQINPILALLNQNYLALSQINISNNQRRELLQFIINYYQQHIENFGELKSLEVLKQVFE